MSDVITRFKLETTQYDSKLRDSVKGLKEVVKTAELAGKDFKGFEKNTLEAAKALGTIETGANNSKDKVKELVGAFNEMAKTYNTMSQEIRDSDVGQAISQSLTQLSGRIKEAKEELYSLGETAKSSDGLFGGSSFTDMLSVAGGNLIASGIQKIGSEMAETIQQSIELARQGEGVRIAFERLNKPGLLDNLKEATHGTVSEIELMKQAIKFENFKLPLEDLATYLAFAQQKAKDTGESIDFLVTSIVNGLGRQSKQILDNLGISAAELTKRMAEGADMTKAVADIIREEMEKAGEYVETSADKAAQADKRLKDAMEDLGRTFQPLSDAGASLWNDLKVGALDLLNNAVRPLIDALTEAGRIRAQYASQGGDSRVNRQIGRLENIHSLQYRRNTYNAQLKNYDTKIGSYEQYLSDYKKWQNDKTAVGAYDRMQAFQKQTGLSMYSDVKEQLEVFKKMRAEYVMGAKSIIADNPAPSPTSPTATTKTTGGSGKSSTPTIDDFNKILAKSMNGSVDLKETKDLLSPYEMMLPEIKKNILDIKDADLGGSLAKLGDKKVTAIMKGWVDGAKETEMAWKSAATAIGTVSSAIMQIQDPGIKIMATIGQAIATVALAYSETLAKDAKSKSNIYAFIAAAAAASISMATTIGAIHSSTGYAEGGMIKGDSYSGDNIPADNFVNAGELVLNRAQQNTLAQALKDDQATPRGPIPARVSGENIFFALESYLRRSGKGELLTWQ